ncbi:PH domain-containing protein [Winogradskyella sp. A3E31]|uniref:PH domain-containing protein n=1 Tax=Winogradskyella sp. A3E31 TaxID=3349637 RepID=UPI00398B1D57
MQKIDFSQPVRQSPKGVIVIFGLKSVQFVRRFFVLFLALGVSIFRKNSFANLSIAVIIGILVLIVIGILVYSILRYLNFKFHVSQDDFHLSSGILNKDTIVVPKSKIQNVNIKQNFLQQLIDVVSINIETAGDDKSEITINALDRGNATRLKEQLFVRRSLSEEADIDVSKIDKSEKKVFFKASIKRLLLEGISENHFKSFLIIVSFFVGIYYQAEEYFESFGIEEQVENNIQFAETVFIGSLFIALIAVLAFLIISILFSVIKMLIINFNLEVIEHHKNIEINKGLFNKMSLTLTPSRIQNIVVKTNRIKEWLGLYRLSVKQAMSNKKQQKNFAIVALDGLQLDYLINKLLKIYSKPENFLKPEGYFKYILWLRLLLVFGLLNIPAYAVIGKGFWLINFLFLVFIAIYVYVRYRKSGYLISDNFITITSGFIDTVTNILEIHKIQSIEISQTIFQKRRGITSVIIATASKSITIPYIKEIDAQAICNNLLYKVESSNRDWM